MKKLILLALVVTFLGSLFVPSGVGAQSVWCSSAGPDGDTVYATSGTRRTYAYGVGGSLGHLYFPTWTEAGGQDDIVWYPGTDSGNGTWYADVNLASHPDLGNIFVHVYVYNSSNQATFCDYANFYRANYTSGPGVTHTIADNCIESAEAQIITALPATMITGQTYDFAVKMRNTGTTWWYHGGTGWNSTSFYQFIQKSGGQSLSLVADYLGSYGVPPTAPPGYGGGAWGERYLRLTAPSTPGTYSLTMQMHHGPFPDYEYQLWDGTVCGTRAWNEDQYQWFGNEITQTFTVSYANCTNTPWGTVNHGSSVTGYAASTADVCQSQTRTCSNGTLSGTYAATGCTVNSYTYNFNGNGATTNPSPTSQTSNYGTAINTPTSPSRTGYTFTGWSPSIPGTMPSGGGTSYAQWSLNSYTVSTSAGTGGSISPTSASVSHGSNTSFTISPSAGYSISSVSGCSGSLSGSTYTTGAITGACTVSASFSLNAPLMQNVTISSTNITPDNSTQYTISAVGSHAAGAGNIIWSGALINYQGGNAGAYRGYLTWGLANHYPSYKDNQACSGGGYGAIQPGYGDSYIRLRSCSVTDSGNNRTVNFAVTFDPSFTSPLTGNDISGYTYNTNWIGNGWTNFDLNFNINTYTITASAGTGGSISPAGVTTKNYGTSQAYTISPSSGYYILDVLVNGSSVGAVSSYTFNNITTNHTISATFASAYPTLGNVTISSININPNNTTQYNIVMTGTNPAGIGGGANISHQYALINYQGSNAGAHRGYLTWYYDTNYTGWDGQKNKMTCGGGGVAAIQSGYGTEYVRLVSCSTSVSGTTRTTTLTITAETAFRTPTTNNDISGYIHNTQGLYVGWNNFDINFNISIDGGWSPWSPLSCPTACGQPESSQTRTCTNPPPENGGATCSGPSSQTCSATPSCNTPPNAPTISGPTTGYPNTSYTYTFTATDPQGDQIRYGIDWNMDGTAEEWLPAGVSYVNSGTSRSTSYSWTTTGEKTFRALTQDYPGSNSGWTNYTVNISAAPVNGTCGTANRTYPVGSTSYGTDTYCSAGTPSATPAFPSPGTSASWICNGLNGGANSGTCTAFNPQAEHNITIGATPKGSVEIDGGITCQPGTTNCPVVYEEGTTIYLRAYPVSSFWKFTGWSGLCTNTSYLCILEVEQPGTITPNFIPRLFDYWEF